MSLLLFQSSTLDYANIVASVVTEGEGSMAENLGNKVAHAPLQDYACFPRVLSSVASPCPDISLSALVITF